MNPGAPARREPGPARTSVLIVCDIVPGHRAAGEVRLVRLTALLAESCSVALVALDRHLADPDDPDDDRTLNLRAKGVEVLDVQGPVSLRAGLVARRYDLVLLEFWPVAERALALVRARQPQALVAVDTVDLHFLREERGIGVGDPVPPGLEDRKRRELAVYAAADARIFTSQDELDVYTATAGRAGRAESNLILSIIVDPVLRSVRPRRPEIVFVGSFWHAPNLDGVRWFAERVWPNVRAARPDATFSIAGSHMGPEVRRLAEVEGIEVLGFVDDIDALYDRAWAAVAPLRFGAGVKGKVVEALAAGLPVVATSIATEGLGLTDGVHLLVADDAEAFAARLIGLLDDAEAGARLGSSGRDAVAGRCGPEPARAVLRALAQQAQQAALGTTWPWLRWWARTLPDRAWLLVRPGLAAATRSTRRRFRQR